MATEKKTTKGKKITKGTKHLPRGGRKYNSPKPELVPLKLTDKRFQGIRLQVALRATHLRAIGWMYQEIPDQLVKEFNIQRPSPGTVCDWVTELDWAASADFAQLQERMRLDAFWQIEKIKSRWIPIALGNVAIKRTEFDAESSTWKETIDEKAYAEQVKAADVVFKAIDRQAKLLKLNLADEIKQNDQVSIHDLQLWIIDRANGIERPIMGKTIDVAPSLKLESGLDNLIDGL